MVSVLVDKLATARGESCQILAVFVDVRGFSAFAGIAESSDAALYLRTLYTRVLRDYFPQADFVKPTGDGLLLVRELGTEEPEVVQRCRDWFNAGIRLIDEFNEITSDDLLITVDVPSAVGLGFARGSATRLVEVGGQVLDYSGRCLNLAARLMDLARPEGLVFEDRHAVRLLGDDLLSGFEEKHVYIRGIAEGSPITVWVTKHVNVRPSALEPLDYQPSFDSTSTQDVGSILQATGWLIRLDREPRAGARIEVAYEYVPRGVDGAELDYKKWGRLTQTRLHHEPEGPYVNVDWRELADRLNEDNMLEQDEVAFTPFH